jgi:hypothetical protein
MKGKILAILLSAIMLSTLTVIATPANAQKSPAVWVNEDLTTGGNWLNAVGSPIGAYGTCAHILPGYATGETPVGEVSIGGVGTDFSTLISTLAPYGDPWAIIGAQLDGAGAWKAESPYYDEYNLAANPSVCTFSYFITGPTVNIPAVGSHPAITVQYPAFTWQWRDSHPIGTGPDANSWYSTSQNFQDVPYVINGQAYTGPKGSGPASASSLTPAWGALSWDSGGERQFNSLYRASYTDYFDFHLSFSNAGTYLVSLYAYDADNGRTTQEYQIMNSAATIVLADKVVSESAMNTGAYESFKITAPTGPYTIVMRVLNNDPNHSINTVLSGVFTECATGTACGLSPGFWYTNANKDLGNQPGNAQVNFNTYYNYLKALWGTGALSGLGFTPAMFPASPTTAIKTSALNEALAILAPPGSGQHGAARALLTILLTGQYVPNYLSAFFSGPGGYHPVSWWITQLLTQYGGGNYGFSMFNGLSNDQCGPIFPITTLPIG